MTKDRFYWIQDAYTLSDKYPISKPMMNENLNGTQPFNYIRNSVKITIDAFDGDVDYYLVDNTDSIANAYNRAYPKLFKPLEKMPAELKSHLRYPRDLYTIQMQIYARYHQTSPELFMSKRKHGHTRMCVKNRYCRIIKQWILEVATIPKNLR